MHEAEKPELEHQPEMAWGSDVVAQSLRSLGIEYVSLNPGASYRGLHDSFVNYLGNSDPSMLLCLHEEHAVAIAHGYAKVTDRPMAVAIHSNVGLMHASMAIFNAYCDRVPILMLGANGPMDATARRPWIDWLHTTSDQAALIRGFVKWDDQPASVSAAVTSLARAFALSSARPSAPTYVCLDWALQETDDLDTADVAELDGLALPVPTAPSAATVEQIVSMIRAAARPVVLFGRATRDEQAWRDRVAFAEALDVKVLTHQKLGAAFPTLHPLHVVDPASHRTPAAQELIREADLVVSFDWLDLAGMLKTSGVHNSARRPDVISISSDSRLHGGWSKDHFDYPFASLSVECDPQAAVSALLDHLGVDSSATLMTPTTPRRGHVAASTEGDDAPLKLGALADVVVERLAEEKPSYIRLPSSWPASHMEWAHPLDYLGCDGGEGIGSGPGMAVGGALALRSTDRLPVAILGDGDFSMGSSALWTAAHYELPLLVIVANNGSYLNDEIHQTHVATVRRRPKQNAWIGQRMTNPALDMAMLARAQGWEGAGPITTATELRVSLDKAVATVRAGGRVLLDVRIEVELERVPRIVEHD
jgi:thiamine pyrophosphate-dependent acetolactate synthase large subunit-like protein